MVWSQSSPFTQHILNAHLDSSITWCKMWCQPGLSCRVTSVQAVTCSREPPASPPPCTALCKPIKPQQEAPSVAEEASERPRACAAQGNAPQRPPSPHFGTRASAAVLSHARGTREQPHSHFSKQNITVWKGSWWARTWCVDDWGRLGGSTFQCYLQKNTWGAKSKQHIFQRRAEASLD